jgi:hypothetical protein
MTAPSPAEPPRISPPPRPPRSDGHASRRLLLVAVALIVLGGGGLFVWDWLSHGRGGESFVKPLPQVTRAVPESAPAPTPPAPNTPPAASPSARSDELIARLAALEARLAQATQPPPSQPAAPNPADAQVAQLQARVATLENAVAVERARADRAQQAERVATEKMQTTLRAAGAIARLRTNLERGYSFEREYDDAGTALSFDPSAVARLAPLRQWSESGIPTRAALREALEVQGGDIVRASILEGAQTWWQGILVRLQALIVSRPTPDGDIPPAGTQEGDRAPAIVARAEARLRDDDIPAALSELTALTGTAADTAQAWIAAARARVSADETMAALDELLRASPSVPSASRAVEKSEPSDAPAEVQPPQPSSDEQ